MLSITEKRIRQIIAEEARKFVFEAEEADVPAGKKMVSAAQGMIALQDAIMKFKETSPEAAAAIEAQLSDLESILSTKLEPLQSLISPAPSSKKFAGPQDLHSPPEEEEVMPSGEEDDEVEEDGEV